MMSLCYVFHFIDYVILLIMNLTIWVEIPELGNLIHNMDPNSTSVNLLNMLLIASHFHIIYTDMLMFPPASCL